MLVVSLSNSEGEGAKTVNQDMVEQVGTQASKNMT